MGIIFLTLILYKNFVGKKYIPLNTMLKQIFFPAKIIGIMILFKFLTDYS
jgi:hypothetical protein